MSKYVIGRDPRMKKWFRNQFLFVVALYSNMTIENSEQTGIKESPSQGENPDGGESELELAGAPAVDEEIGGDDDNQQDTNKQPQQTSHPTASTWSNLKYMLASGSSKKIR